MKRSIPIYDICTIAHTPHPDLLIERLETYLAKHYANLHTAHRHSFYHLVFFTEGQGKHTIDFNRYKVKPYQIYFMSPGQVHSWHFEGKTAGFIVHFNAGFYSSFLQRADYIEQFPFFTNNPEEAVYNLPAGLHDNTKELFEAMIRETNLDLVRILLLQLFIQVDRCCVKDRPGNIPQQKLLTLNLYKSLIEKHYKSLKLPKEYAELMYVTPNYLNALCQDVLGKSAGELIRDRVVLEAKRLLTNAGMDISEIAYSLNFQDNSYFSRFFKKSTGTSPEEFRKKLTK